MDLFEYLNDRSRPKNLSRIASKAIIDNYISNGGNINDTSELNDSLAILALRKKEFEFVKYLIEIGINLNIVNVYNETLLYYCVMDKYYDILKIIINKSNNIKALFPSKSFDFETRILDYKRKFYELGETKFKIWVNML